MNITDISWYKYPLKNYNKDKKSYVPLCVMETDANLSDISDVYISVSLPKNTAPTFFTRKYEINSAGIVEQYVRYYNNYEDNDPYIDLKSYNDGGYGHIGYEMLVHAKNDRTKKVWNTQSSASLRDEDYSTTAIAIIVHTADDWYSLGNIMFLESKSLSVVNIDSKGIVTTKPSFQVSFDDYNGTNKMKDTAIREILGVSKRVDPDDPYDGGDDKGDDDNNPGDYDHTSDPIPEPDLPSVSVTDSGLVTLFAPTESQLKSLANYLWSDAFSLDSFKKMLNNPMDCILGLSIVPVNVPRGSAREITVGNIVTTVSCDICPTQYVKVDCGTFTFDRHNMTNSYLDYSPYSKCYLYLPFIGVQEINIDEFMQSTMHVVYHVDILTGAMFCYVMRDSSVMYTYMGQCAENVPLSSSSYSNTIGSIMTAAASIVGVASVAATGGASAPVAAGLLAGATTSTSNAVTSLKPSVAHSGSIGGGAGIMGVNYPYLIFNTPHVSIPSQQRHYTGYPSNQIVKLSALSGFNVIQAINLSVSGANDSEMNEIENILKGGVIL